MERKNLLASDFLADPGIIFSLGNMIMFWETGGLPLALTSLSFVLAAGQITYRNSQTIRTSIKALAQGPKIDQLLSNNYAPLVTNASLLGLAGIAGVLKSDFSAHNLLSPLAAIAFSTGNLFFSAAQSLTERYNRSSFNLSSAQKMLMSSKRFLSPALTALGYGLIAAQAGSLPQAAIPVTASATGGIMSVAKKDQAAFLTFAVACGLTAALSLLNGIVDVGAYSGLFGVASFRLYQIARRNDHLSPKSTDLQPR